MIMTHMSCETKVFPLLSVNENAKLEDDQSYLDGTPGGALGYL
jgi:hypothetical protein